MWRQRNKVVLVGEGILEGHTPETVSGCNIMLRYTSSVFKKKSSITVRTDFWSIFSFFRQPSKVWNCWKRAGPLWTSPSVAILGLDCFPEKRGVKYSQRTKKWRLPTFANLTSGKRPLSRPEVILATRDRKSKMRGLSCCTIRPKLVTLRTILRHAFLMVDFFFKTEEVVLFYC